MRSILILTLFLGMANIIPAQNSSDALSTLVNNEELKHAQTKTHMKHHTNTQHMKTNETINTRTHEQHRHEHLNMNMKHKIEKYNEQ